jgi:hypothetical protein
MYLLIGYIFFTFASPLIFNPLIFAGFCKHYRELLLAFEALPHLPLMLSPFSICYVLYVVRYLFSAKKESSPLSTTSVSLSHGEGLRDRGKWCRGRERGRRQGRGKLEEEGEVETRKRDEEARRVRSSEDKDRQGMGEGRKGKKEGEGRG